MVRAMLKGSGGMMLSKQGLEDGFGLGPEIGLREDSKD